MAARKDGKQGHKSDKLWRDAIMVAVKRETEKGSGSKRLFALADALVEKALKGDVTALKEIGDRLDGKAVQGVELGGPGGGPMQVEERMSATRAALLILATMREAEENQE
jgi:hypothetical protein